MCRFISWKIGDAVKPHEPSSCKAGVILLDQNNRFLLVENYGHRWTFPKGGVEPGETTMEAAARELFEETGIAVPAADLKIYFRYYKQTYFLMNARGADYDEQLISNKSEITGVGWGCFEHLEDLDLTLPTAKILRLLQADIKMTAKAAA